MSDLLSQDAIAQELAAIAGWSRDGDALRKTWERKGFNGAVALANVVAYVANEINHHPDITVHGYNKVTVATTTHAAGGVTSNDIALAKKLNSILG